MLVLRRAALARWNLLGIRLESTSIVPVLQVFASWLLKNRVIL